MKENHKFKCIVSDLDGTLLGKGGVLSEYAKIILEELMRKGIWFVPASGRPLCSYPEEIKNLSGLRYSIMSNGAMLYDWKEKQVVWCSKVPDTTVETLHSLLSEYEVVYEISVDGIAYAEQKYYEDPSLFGTGDNLKSYVQSTRIPVSNMKQFMLQQKKNIDSVIVLVKEEKKIEIFEKIQSKLTGVYMTTSVPHLIEITSIDGGKHRAVHRLCDRLNINVEEVVAFGDAQNDKEMIREVGLGIAVENAVMECKEVADRIIESNLTDAVAKELRKIFR